MQREPDFPPDRPELTRSEPAVEAGVASSQSGAPFTPESHRLELREEELVPRKEWQQLGEVVVRTQIEEFPGRLELDALREEVEVQHVPMGEVVQDRREPWEEDGTLVIPMYEEQLVVVKRLVMREQVRIKRLSLTEKRLFEETLRRDRLAIEDPSHTGRIRVQQGEVEGEEVARVPAEGEAGDKEESGGIVERVVRRVIS